MKKNNLILISLLAISISSNASRYKVQYDKLVANIEATGTKSVSIATLDHRAKIQKEGSSPDCVGYLRSTVGIPFSVETKSKNPFSDDVSSSINESFAKKGFKCSVTTTTPKDSTNTIADKLKNSGSDISILFVTNLWWTDTHMATLLEYDVTVNIYDKSGSLLVSKNFTESSKGLGANIWGSEYQKYIPNGFTEALERFFNNPEVKKVLE